MTGYKYNTELEAQGAVQQCNIFYGIPVSPSSTTQNWCNYYLAEFDDPIFWFIPYDESLHQILGSPVNFVVSDQNPVN